MGESINFCNIAEVVALNEHRRKLLFSDYNPITGQGSPIARFKLYLDDKRFLLLPETTRRVTVITEIEACGSLAKYAKLNNLSAGNLEKVVTSMRIIFDFEFWAATCAIIQDKLTKREIPFVLRQPQRKLLKTMYDAFSQERPIRVILLNARQWGGSTLVQLFMAWMQLFHYKGWHSVIVADVEEQARTIRAMYTRMAKHHPVDIQPVEFIGFEGSTKNKKIKERDCVIYIGSVQKPDSIRSADVMMAHLTEVGLWKETKGKSPKDIAQSISGTVPVQPGTVIVMESTAKGVGNFFHTSWSDAVNGESGYDTVFVAWWEIEIYQRSFTDHAQMVEFVKSMSPQEKFYFSIGATLEGVHWYRYKKHLDKMDDWRMCCEFPSTPREAFQSTGRRAHAPEYVEQMRRFVREPKWRGDIFSDAQIGREAIGKTLEFRQTPGGDLYVWEKPDITIRMKNRYVVSVDIGGRTDVADWSVISVIDRYWLSDGGVEEVVATWRGHLDQDLVIWKAVQIAKWYNNALLVPEANSLNAKGQEGDHSLTILDEIKGDYDNIYCRTDPQKVREGVPARYGFFTSTSSKTDLVNQMNKRFREMGYIERDVRMLNEADCYEIKENGTYGAVSGQHDDIYMSRGIGLKASSIMDAPVLIEERATRSRSICPKVLSESNF